MRNLLRGTVLLKGFMTILHLPDLKTKDSYFSYQGIICYARAPAIQGLIRGCPEKDYCVNYRKTSLPKIQTTNVYQLSDNQA